MGLVKKKDTTMYWNTKCSCLSTPYFGTVMSRNNFQLISKYLHCFDNTRPEAKRDNALYDPLHKFRLVLDALNCSCKKHYIPKQLISIDESLIGLNNRTELIQYIPNKHHHKWGVKPNPLKVIPCIQWSTAERSAVGLPLSFAILMMLLES